MAIAFYPNEKRYIGLSTDNIGTITQEGAQIYFTDTKDTLICHGGVWYPYVPGNNTTIVTALPSGTNVVGKVSIDQTVPGTTNAVQVVSALPAGTNAIGTIEVTSLPAIPPGANNIGLVTLGKNVQTASTNTTVALAASGTFTGTNVLVDGYSLITGTVYSDQAGTLYIDQSSDGTNYDVTTNVSVSAATGVSFSVQVVAPNARIRYVNGATAQTTFRLYSFLRSI